ncbi:MAG TPA: hypothetical protein VLX61_03805 [Anaerolineales bacterium]|nr:hypothetical protein [Anaerolineales bacterium]
MGMAILTTVGSFLSLFVPLAGTAIVLTTLGGILIAVLTRPWKHLSVPSYHPLVWLLLAVVTIAILENATHKPTNYDTALYHAQVIHWIESYRVVPGLANLHDRLAYNSSWLVLVASLSFAFLGLQSFHLTNSVIVLTATMYFGQSFQSLIQKQYTLANIAKAILFFLPLGLYASDLSSPGTDLPPALMAWVLTALILEKVETGGLDFDMHSVVIFILSAFAVTVKLSVVVLFAPSLLLLIQLFGHQDWQRAAALLTTALIVFLPWLLRSVVLSGYLIFPVAQIDLFSFDWKYPLSAAAAVQNETFWFTRFPSNTQEYVGMTAAQWVPIWFHQLPKGHKILVAAALISPVGLPALKFNGAGRRVAGTCMLAFLLNYLGIFFWLFTAPSFRFGYTYLLASIILGGAPVILLFTKLVTNSAATVSISLATLAILFQLYIVATTTSIRTLPGRVLLPANYSPSSVQFCSISNTTFYCAQSLGLCNYEAFPCIPKPRTDVEMRGTSLQDGFRTVRTP